MSRASDGGGMPARAPKPKGADLAARVAQWIRPEIRAQQAYHVPDAAGLIKLDAMENPYTWPPEVVEEWLDTLRAVSLNRYPDPDPRALKERLRATWSIPAGQDLLLGNGSDELIQMLMLAVSGPGRTALAPEPTFVMYRMIANVVGLGYEAVALRRDDFALDAEAMCAAIARAQPALVFLSYPNNPTGNLFEREALEAVVEAAPGLVIIDEAYTPFAQASCLDWLERYEHLLILRTVSKLGLAGLRLGLLIGARAWLEQIDKTRLPYNINVLTQISTEFALRHWDLLVQQTERIRADRERLVEALRRMPGLEVFPSRANFILFRVRERDAGAVFEALRAAGVLIKNLHQPGGPLARCLRVTVGRPEENEAFLAALERALGTTAP